MRGCGRIQRPAFPAPSDVSDGESTSKTRAHRAARSRRCGCERRGWFTSPRLRGEVGDGAKQSLRVRGTIRKCEPVESPPSPARKMLATSPHKRCEVKNGDAEPWSGLLRLRSQ